MADRGEAVRARQFDSETASLLLIGSKQEKREAIALIQRHLARLIVWKIRQVAPGLADEDVEDIYQEVLLAVLEKAEEDVIEPGDLVPYLLTLARNKTVDRLRKRAPVLVEADQLLDAVTERLGGTEVGEAWKRIIAEEEGQRILGLIRQEVAQMPKRQRQVAEALLRRIPEPSSLQEIREEIQRSTGESLTVVAAKSALREVRTKIRQLLERHGYNCAQRR